MPEIPDIWRAALPVIELLDSWKVPCLLGGSVASSFLGVARSTLDVDLVADLKPVHGPMLAQALEESYYLSEKRVRGAIRRRKSFNLIHLSTMFKVDVFVQPDRDFDRLVMARRVSLEVADIHRTLDFSTAEDVILHKLLWYRDGNRVSRRQWNDVQGVLRLQRDLDLDHLSHWASELGVSDLLDEAMLEARVGSP